MTSVPPGDQDRPRRREAETWGEYEWSEPGAEREPAPDERETLPEPDATTELAGLGEGEAEPDVARAPDGDPEPDLAREPEIARDPEVARDPGPAPVQPPAAVGPERVPPSRLAGTTAPELATGAPRVYRGELTSALGALALLALMFATKWYGVAGVPDPSAARPAISTAENAWDGLTLVRWVMIVCIVVVIGSVVLHASQRSHGTRTDTSLIILGLGGLTFALLFYRVLLVLPQADRVIDQKLGAVLGLACALAITLGGVESVHEQQRFQRDLARRPRRRRQMRTGGEGRWSSTGDRARVAPASSIPDGSGGTGPAAE